MDPIEIEPRPVVEAECCDEELALALTGATVGQSEHPSAVQLNLQTSGLSLQLNSQPPLAQVIELSAKLELVLSQLKESANRLESAFFRIGFLEAELEEKKREIVSLKEKQPQA